MPRTPKFNDETVIDVVKSLQNPIVTAQEVADELDESRRTVHRRLKELSEKGRIGRKKVGGRSVVYWIDDPVARDKDTHYSTSHPMTFADDTAKSQLDTHGKVVTFRKNKRSTVGRGWWNEERGGAKKGDMIIGEIGEVDPRTDEALQPYRELSGFDTIDDWRDAMSDLNNGLPDLGYLYLVVAGQGQ